MERARRLKKGWKVVDWEGESPCAVRGRVKYKLFHVTKPRQGYGPLVVFKDLREAENFRNHLCVGSTVFPILYIPSKTRALYYREKKCYSNKTELLRLNPTMLLPRTMDFADIVILLPQEEER